MSRTDAVVAGDSAVQTALSLRGIDKWFGRTRALDDVSLDVAAGEVHCLVGENGAGKSTLLKILAGAERPDGGELVIGDDAYDRLAPRQAIELGVATLYQEPDLVSSLSVAENVFLGDERMRGPVIDRATHRAETLALAERLHVPVVPDAFVEELSPGEKQVVQVLKALRHDARVLVMDEPTSSLGPAEKEALHALVRQLASQGIAILYVSHFLEEVFEVGDRITVLKDGRRVATHVLVETSLDEVVQEMVGRAQTAVFQRKRADLGEVALRVENYSGAGVDEVSFEVRRGEVFGLGGLVGSGRSELLELLFGATKRGTGRLVLDGTDVTPRTPAQAIARGICMLTEDRQGTGLLRERPVRENIAVARNELNGVLLGGERAVATRMVEALRIVTGGVDQEVASLSGGNQQKTLLGRWLAVEGAEVFLLDEPTKGVDIGAKHEIYRLVEELAQRGKIVVLVTSDLPELIALSDRIGVMRAGRLVRVVEPAETSEQSLAKEFLGVAAA